MASQVERDILSAFDQELQKANHPKDEQMIVLGMDIQQQEPSFNQKYSKSRKYEESTNSNNTYNIISTQDNSIQGQNNNEIFVEQVQQNQDEHYGFVDFQNKKSYQKSEDREQEEHNNSNMKFVQSKYQVNPNSEDKQEGNQSQKAVQEDNQANSQDIGIGNQIMSGQYNYNLHKKKLEQKKISDQKKKIQENQQQQKKDIQKITKSDFKFEQNNKVTNILQDEEELGEVGEMIEKTAHNNRKLQDDDMESDEFQKQKDEDDEFDQAFDDGIDKGVVNDNKKSIFEEENDNQNIDMQGIEKAQKQKEQAKHLANQKLKGKTSELGNRTGFMVNKLSSKAALIKVQEQDQTNTQHQKQNQENKVSEKEERIVINQIKQEQSSSEPVLNMQEEENEEDESRDKAQSQKKQQDGKNKINSDDLTDYCSKDEVMSPEELRRLSIENRKNNPISEDEWDRINKETIQLQNKQKSQEKQLKQIQYIDAWNTVKNIDFSQQMKLLHNETISEQNFFQRLCAFCSKSNNTLSKPSLLRERDTILAFSKIKFDDQDNFHFQMIFSIYTQLTQNNACLRYGTHWEEIGFQGTDPASDIRGGGMFGILQILAFVCNYKIYLQDALEYSQHDKYNFPLSCTLLNITVIVITLLKQGKLNDMINAEKQVMSIINLVYFASFYTFFENYKAKQYTIHDHSNCLKQTKEAILNSPKKYVMAFKKKIDRYYKDRDV